MSGLARRTALTPEFGLAASSLLQVLRARVCTLAFRAAVHAARKPTSVRSNRVTDSIDTPPNVATSLLAAPRINADFILDRTSSFRTLGLLLVEMPSRANHAMPVCGSMPNCLDAADTLRPEETKPKSTVCR